METNYMKTELRIFAQCALLGAITPNIRKVYIGLIDKTIQLVFVFDGKISENDIDNASCVGTEIVANYNDLLINEQFISIPPPKDYIMPEDYFCVYARKE